MKKASFYKYIVIILILSGVAIFLFINCVIRIPEGYFTLFKDAKSGDVKILSSGTHYLLQGIIPGRVKLHSFRNLNNELITLKIAIPALDSLTNDFLYIKTTLFVSFLINNEDLQISNLPMENDNIFRDIMMRNIEINFKSELMPYLLNNYNLDLIIKDSNKIIERLFAQLKKQAKETGLDIQKLELRSPIELPSKEIVDREIKYLNELKDIEKNNKKELLILQTKLLNEQKTNENYYSKLREISKLIKENPDLLKFIYIDKIADKVKVIISSDKSCLPPGLVNENDLEKSKDGSILENLK